MTQRTTSDGRLGLVLFDEDGGGDRLQAWRFEDGTIGIRVTEGTETGIVYLSPDDASELKKWLA